jgi:hypothetical protein
MVRLSSITELGPAWQVRMKKDTPMGHFPYEGVRLFIKVSHPDVVVLIYQDGDITVILDPSSTGSESANELYLNGAIHALSLVPEGASGILSSTSDYLIGCCNRLDEWERNDWRKADGKPPVHLEKWKEIKRLRDEREITFGTPKSITDDVVQMLNSNCEPLSILGSNFQGSLKLVQLNDPLPSPEKE